MAEIQKFQDHAPTKWEKFKEGVKEKASAAYDWCKEHKEIVLAVVPVVISGGFELAKAGMKYRDKREDRELEEEKLCSVYDRSNGMYLDTIRPLTNDDARQVQNLKRQGLTTLEALDRLGLLA